MDGRAMLGKRLRSVRGGLAMGLECFPADAIARAEEFVKKQESPRGSSPCGHRLIVGFDLKPSPDRDDGVESERRSSSTKSCRPTSGLESLLSAPRAHGSKHLPSAMASAIAAQFSEHNPRLDRHQKKSCAFVGSPGRDSHPIPVSHSPFREALSPSPASKVPIQSSAGDDPKHSGRSSLKQSFKATGDGGERCVFSLMTASPGASDGAEYLSCCSMDFLEACFLCKRRLGHGHDIFMYRDDKAFCSAECRQHQIVIDEHAELGKKYISSIQKRSVSSVQSRRSNHRTTRVLAVSTAAAA